MLGMDYFIICWDHGDQPDWHEFRVAAEASYIFPTEVPDTGGDTYAVVVAAQILTPDQAQQAWKEYEDDLNHDPTDDDYWAPLGQPS